MTILLLVTHNISWTYSAIAKEDVKPGDSMPIRLINPAKPCSFGPWIIKSDK